MPRLTHEQWVARDLVKTARAELGEGWKHVSLTIRQGLVARRIIYVALGQDNEADGIALNRYTRALMEETDRILEEEAEAQRRRQEIV